MKRITIQLAAIIIILLFISGCDKDIRDKYVGDWEFITKVDSAQFDYDLNDWIPLGFDSVFYEGRIILGKFDDELIIQYTERDEVTARINHNGNLWTSVYSIAGTNSRHGYFEENNKMYLTLYYFKYGGFSSHHFIEGTKKRKEKK